MTEHNPETNINESNINASPKDKKASDRAAVGAQGPGEAVESTHDDKKLTDQLGETARKMATETAYVAAGFAGLVGEKAKNFYDEQRKQYSDAHPDEDEQKTKSFLDQLSDQLNRFADDLNRGYKDLAERGRDVVQRGNLSQRGQGEGSANDGETAVDGDAATYSSDISGDVDETTTKNRAQDAHAPSRSANNDGESDLAPGTPPFSSNLSEDVSEKAPSNDDVLGGPDKRDGIL